MATPGPSSSSVTWAWESPQWLERGRILGLKPPCAWLWGDPQPNPELLGFLIPPAGSCAGLPHRNEADHALPVNRPSDGDVPAGAGARAPSAAGLSLCLVGILHFSGTGPVVNAANPSPRVPVHVFKVACINMSLANPQKVPVLPSVETPPLPLSCACSLGPSLRAEGLREECPPAYCWLQDKRAPRDPPAW